jgi:putative phage-type endonuclease
MNAVIQQPTFTPEEQMERRSWIGGSEAATSINLDPYRQPYDLWQEKLGLVAPFAGNELTLWGKLHEPAMRQQYAERTQRVLRLPEGNIIHPAHRFMACHPDGVTDDRRLYEGKTSRYGDGFGEEGTDQVPQQYLIQCQHNMAVTGLPVADLAVLIGGSEFRLYEIPADRELQQLIIDGEAHFWDYVMRQTTPPIDLAREDAIRCLQKMYVGTSGEVLTAKADAVVLRQELEAAAEAEKAATTAKNAAKAGLLKIMQEASSIAFADGMSFRRQQISRKEYTVKATTYMDARWVKSK